MSHLSTQGFTISLHSITDGKGTGSDFSIIPNSFVRKGTLKLKYLHIISYLVGTYVKRHACCIYKEELSSY